MYTLHSGGATGSDVTWGQLLMAFDKNAIIKHYYIDGFKTPFGNTPVEILDGSDDILKEIAKRLNRHFPTKNLYVNNLLRRNMHQVIHSDATFAIGSIKDDIVQGGTGWAIELSKIKKHPTYVFSQDDSQWYEWKDKFIECDVPTLTKDFAGIGTRNLQLNGRLAIEAVLRKS